MWFPTVHRMVSQQPSRLPSILPARRSQWRDWECPVIRKYQGFSCVAGVLGSSCWHRDLGHEAAKREVGVFTSQVPVASTRVTRILCSLHASTWSLEQHSWETEVCHTQVSHLSRWQRWPELEFVLSLASLKSIWESPEEGQSLQPWPAVAPPSCKLPVALLLLKVSRRRLTASLPRSRKKSKQAKTTTENDSVWEFDYPYVRRKICHFLFYCSDNGSLC